MVSAWLQSGAGFCPSTVVGHQGCSFQLVNGGVAWRLITGNWKRWKKAPVNMPTLRRAAFCYSVTRLFLAVRFFICNVWGIRMSPQSKRSSCLRSIPRSLPVPVLLSEWGVPTSFCSTPPKEQLLLIGPVFTHPKRGEYHGEPCVLWPKAAW